ncbi:MAG: molybdenum cofactor biosynthesis protein MoaE [Candidatus Riflebacteria bacterium]|nr:molybdenum cofactor biosynthesis protein MoaE [Candidatus Riflebacteria bacterium]
MAETPEREFSIDEEIEKIKASSNDIGAIAILVSVVRGGSHLEFECYDEMAQKRLREIEAEAIRKFDVIDARITHRKGRMGSGENITFVMVAARHRKSCLEACESCVAELKKGLAIWKEEIG